MFTFLEGLAIGAAYILEKGIDAHCSQKAELYRITENFEKAYTNFKSSCNKDVENEFADMIKNPNMEFEIWKMLGIFKRSNPLLCDMLDKNNSDLELKWSDVGNSKLMLHKEETEKWISELMIKRHSENVLVLLLQTKGLMTVDRAKLKTHIEYGYDF